MRDYEILPYNQIKSYTTTNDAAVVRSNVVLTQTPKWTASRADPGFYQYQAIRPMLVSSGWVACFVFRLMRRVVSSVDEAQATISHIFAVSQPGA